MNPHVRPRTQSVPLSGRSLPRDAFAYSEAVNLPDAHTLRKLLHGTAVAHVVHDYLSQQECERLKKAILDTSEAYERDDDVGAREIGCGHYGKTTEEYFTKGKNGLAMARIYQGSGVNLEERMSVDIQRALDPGVILRPALHHGQSAQHLRTAAWQCDGAYALRPHEDISQMSDPRQAGFEIQAVQTIVATNTYPSMSAKGGQLRIWNIRPDLETRQRLGIASSGHPYPIESLNNVDFMDIAITAGDSVFVQGNFVHAVLQSEGDQADSPRLTINGFFGYGHNGSVVLQWT